MLSEKVKRNEIKKAKYEKAKAFGWKQAEKRLVGKNLKKNPVKTNAFANVALAKESAVSENERGAKTNDITIGSNKAQETQMKTETQFMPHANAQLSLFDMSVADTNTKPLSFAEACDLVASGKYNRYNAIKVCDTPEIFVKAGLEKLPMLYTAEHLKNAIHKKNIRNARYHGFALLQLKQLPELLSDPAIILDTLSKTNHAVGAV